MQTLTHTAGKLCDMDFLLTLRHCLFHFFKALLHCNWIHEGGGCTYGVKKPYLDTVSKLIPAMKNFWPDCFQLQGILERLCFISLLAKLRLASARLFYTSARIFHYCLNSTFLFICFPKPAVECWRVLGHTLRCQLRVKQMPFNLALHKQEELLSRFSCSAFGKC